MYANFYFVFLQILPVWDKKSIETQKADSSLPDSAFGLSAF